MKENCIDRNGQQFGNYRLSECLGGGGFACVYKAEHIYLKTQAAIKLLQGSITKEEQEAFLIEAQTVARLKHPHIIEVLDFGIEGNIPFLVMLYTPKGSLRANHPKSSLLSLSTVVSYVKQIAEALQYAHDQKVVHRDVKPENMLLDSTDEVLLSDFGIAVIAHKTASLSTKEAIGTVTYMAPEQLRGKPRPASDQYSLGVVVYEWLSGICPFQGASSIEVAMKHLSDSPPPLREKISTLSPEVEQVVMQALAKQPEDRFASVQLFAAALEEAYNKELASQLALRKNKEHWLTEGDIHFANRQYEKAIGAYRFAISLDPSSALAFQHRGLAYKELNEYQKAITDYSHALELDPTLVGTYNVRGNAYFALNEHQKAIDDWSCYLAQVPMNAPTYLSRGTAYFALGGYQKAIDDCSRALEIDHTLTHAYYVRGVAYEKLNEYQKAISDFDRALTLDPTFAGVYNHRGDVYDVLKEYQKAISDYDCYLALNSTDVFVYLKRSTNHFALGNYQKAIDDWDHALELDPNLPEVRAKRDQIAQWLRES